MASQPLCHGLPLTPGPVYERVQGHGLPVLYICILLVLLLWGTLSNTGLPFPDSGSALSLLKPPSGRAPKGRGWRGSEALIRILHLDGHCTDLNYCTGIILPLAKEGVSKVLIKTHGAS